MTRSRLLEAACAWSCTRSWPSCYAPVRAEFRFKPQGVRALEASGALGAAQLLHLSGEDVLSEARTTCLAVAGVGGFVCAALCPTSSSASFWRQCMQ